ncbi:preprotein translocase subunit SecA [Chloroflexota bacterium]
MLKWLEGLLDSNEKEIKRFQPLVNRINEIEPDFQRLDDAGLRAKTDEFKARLNNGGSLDELLPEAFAAVREAARRTIGQRHFDAQLMGGIVLHQGKIAEMKTGEGKTLVATLPLYLNALTGRGCHLATVNDYLARRDPYWMGPVYHALGISVASIYPQQNPDEHLPSCIYDPDYDSGDSQWRHFRPVSRRQAYEADITYGTSSEFGFDYLRDNMVLELSRCVQSPLHFTVVDEVDNLLIDEARTPLIISGTREESLQEYAIFARVAAQLREKRDDEDDGDYKMSEKGRAVDEITEAGYENAERILKREGVLKSGSLYDTENTSLLHHLRNAITAREAYHRDREYIVKDGQVVIVDEFTGRTMFGRRYSEGLHQAIEAKEHVKVQRESVTLATVTIQNYFRMYEKVGGMTGTAVTEAEEFSKIYKLDVVVIPTNKPMIRQDYSDQIYKDEDSKFKAVVREIERLHQEECPVLVGTVSIEKSEKLGGLLTKKGIPYHLLNAKNHEKEAGIIAQAGKPGAVTVATNMAGRGVDIILGGNTDGQDDTDWQKSHNKVVELGGLYIIGTERHEARRIDNQLRGRAGRQGDPGSSRFYVSLEDDIVRRFGGDRIKGLMDRVGMDEDTPIENTLVNKAIGNAQIRVEGYHFDMRKHLVEYDDVVNRHRELIYGERRKILEGAELKTNILSMVSEEIESLMAAHIADEHGVDWDISGLLAEVGTIFPLPAGFKADAFSDLGRKEIEARLVEQAAAAYEEREKETGSEDMRRLERVIMLRIMDNLWIDHLTVMEYMRQGIGLQSVAQRDPLVAYKREGHNLFQGLMAGIQHDVVHTVYHVTIARDEAPRKKVTPVRAPVAASVAGGVAKSQPSPKAAGPKVGRNDSCPCGSGKKYKRCCGK